MIRLTQETGTLATRNIVTSRPPHIVTVLKLQLSGSIAFEQTYFLLNFFLLIVLLISFDLDYCFTFAHSEIKDQTSDLVGL